MVVVHYNVSNTSTGKHAHPARAYNYVVTKQVMLREKGTICTQQGPSNSPPGPAPMMQCSWWSWLVAWVPRLRAQSNPNGRINLDIADGIKSPSGQLWVCRRRQSELLVTVEPIYSCHHPNLHVPPTTKYPHIIQLDNVLAQLFKFKCTNNSSIQFCN